REHRASDCSYHGRDWGYFQTDFRDLQRARENYERGEPGGGANNEPGWQRADGYWPDGEHHASDYGCVRFDYGQTGSAQRENDEHQFGGDDNYKSCRSDEFTLAECGN